MTEFLAYGITGLECTPSTPRNSPLLVQLAHREHCNLEFASKPWPRHPPQTLPPYHYLSECSTLSQGFARPRAPDVAASRLW
jgi:hypothetical protein